MGNADKDVYTIMGDIGDKNLWEGKLGKWQQGYVLLLEKNKKNVPCSCFAEVLLLSILLNLQIA